MDQIKLDHGTNGLLLVPGNHGEKIARKEGINLPSVKMSNYVGESIQYAYGIGFRSMTILGHVGKLSKLSIGAFNTHSRICDIRLDGDSHWIFKSGGEVPYS
jgi:cobalt-precorrin-5B (C1)-methyltransferase